MINRRSVCAAMPLMFLPKISALAAPFLNIEGNKFFSDNFSNNFSNNEQINIALQIPQINVNIANASLHFTAIVNFFGYAQAAFSIAQVIGIVPSGNKEVLSGIRALAERIDAAKEEILNWLENYELRNLSSEVISSTRDIKAYSDSKDETFKASMRAIIVNQFNKNETHIRQKIQEVDKLNDSMRVMHYGSLFSLLMSNRRMFFDLLNKNEEKISEARTVFSPTKSDIESYKNIAQKCYNHLEKYLNDNVSLNSKIIRQSGSRISGRTYTFQSGFTEFGQFTPIGNPWSAWEPGEKTGENASIREIDGEKTRLTKEQFRKLKEGAKLAKERRTAALKARNARYQTLYGEIGKRFAVLETVVERSST